MNWADKLRESIQRLSAERGESLNKISLKAGLQRTALRNILNQSSKRPGFDTVVKLADYFGLSVEELIGRPPPGIPAELVRLVAAKVLALDAADRQQRPPQELAEMIARICQSCAASGNTFDLELLAAQIDAVLAYERAAARPPRRAAEN